jgi:hypothetical protein
MADNQPSLGALAATSISGQALGGALAVVYMAYHPLAGNADASSQSVEDALTVIFSTITSVTAMLCHIIGVVLWQKYMTPKP